jgi:hypothetical protein
MGQAPEGEPFFWRQPSCRPAIFPARQSPAAYPPHSGAPSPSAAGPRASLPVPISTPKEKTRRKTGRAARASGHRNRTAILSYAEHGRSRAIAQERTHPPFCRGKKGRKRRSSLWRRPLRLSSSAMSYDLSGPRVVHKRKESRARRCSRSPDERTRNPGNRCSRSVRPRMSLALMRATARYRRNDVLNRNRAIPGWLFQRLRCCAQAPTGKRWESAPKHAVIRSDGLAKRRRRNAALRRKSKHAPVRRRPPTRRRSRGCPAN